MLAAFPPSNLLLALLVLWRPQGSAEYVIDGHGLAATSFNVQNESIGMADSVADWKIPST